MRLLNSDNGAQELAGAGVKVCTIFTLTPPLIGVSGRPVGHAPQIRSNNRRLQAKAALLNPKIQREEHTGRRERESGVCASREGAFVAGGNVGKGAFCQPDLLAGSCAEKRTLLCSETLMSSEKVRRYGSKSMKRLSRFSSRPCWGRW